MIRIEKTIFISYRRTNLPWALCVYQNLTMHGYDVFFDYQSIDSGNFEKVILDNIKARAHFLIILTPSALVRCKEPDDWLRREIETAIDEKRNIVPLMLESFDFGSSLVKKALTGKLSALSTYNGLQVPSEYFLEAMGRLRDRYLNIALDNITLPSLNTEVQEITETQKSAASEAAPVEQEELTAQEWFERGYRSIDKEERIRFYTEAIRLDTDFSEAYYQRGSNRQDRGDLDGAIADYTDAIRIKPEYAEAYNNRGNARLNKEDFIGAIADYTLSLEYKNPEPYLLYSNRAYARRLTKDPVGAIEDYTEVLRINPDSTFAYNNRGNLYRILNKLESAVDDYEKVIMQNPSDVIARSSLMSVLRKLGKEDQAKEQEEIVRELIKNAKEYNKACFEAACGNIEKALVMLQIAIEKKQVRKQIIQQDPDLESIRDDPRFRKLISE
ncbi:MAG: tetratricopeptide repeat protein [Anaerolineae bacterium]|jgi:tetratricopeptide (TPR) repeat protein|nr:tetratricopeptide repeat protein [Anaerolineae bacterium]MBT7990867.1 tetratricopeptide repeat protein [Anaerolineae bacterium]